MDNIQNACDNLITGMRSKGSMKEPDAFEMAIRQGDLDEVRRLVVMATDAQLTIMLGMCVTKLEWKIWIFLTDWMENRIMLPSDDADRLDLACNE